MSIWNQIISLPEEARGQLFSIYNRNFPIEIRMSLAGWIEMQNWSCLIDNNLPSLNHRRAEIIDAFTNEIKKLIALSDDVTYRYKLSEYLNMIVNPGSDLLTIIKNINFCLNYEKEFLKNHFENKSSPQIENGNNKNYGIDVQILNRINCIKEHLSKSETLSKNIRNLKQAFNIGQLELSNYEIPNANSNDNQNLLLKKGQLMEHLSQLNVQYQAFTQELIKIYRLVLGKLQEISLILFNELDGWKQQQRSIIFKNNKNIDSSERLIPIKNLSENIARHICSLWQQLRFINTLISNDTNEDATILQHFIDIKKQSTILFKNLINETFIVKTQPKQVIKKETKFDATVSLLIGNVLNVPMNNLVVRVQIINEEQAKIWYNDRENFLFTSHCGEIVNQTSMMEFNLINDTLSANFINLRLKYIRRAEKKASIDKVMDEKFALLFTTEIQLEDIKFVASTISVPVAVIVHGNQKIPALSTIIWDNSFSELKRVPFNVPMEVKLGSLVQVLSKLFYEFSKRYLRDDNIHFLAEKVSGREIDPSISYDLLIPWTKFSKDLLPDQIFSFWEWFYNIYLLTREHLREIWADGHIIGFITRANAEKLLMPKPPGTFLLRFSDTQLGGISVAYKNLNNAVDCLNPFVSNDLKIRKIADRLNDLEGLTRLYPDIPKGNAFSKYYTKVENQSSNGYVMTQLRNCIPNENGQIMGQINDQSNMMVNYETLNSCSADLNQTSLPNVMSYDSATYDWNSVSQISDASLASDDFHTMYNM